MSRWTCPEEFSDQKIIWRQLMNAGDMCAGMGEYGLCNQLYALCGRIKSEVQVFNRRYVKDNTADDARVREALAELTRLGEEMEINARVCLTHSRMNVCRPGMREEDENGQASCKWSEDPEHIRKLLERP